MAKAFDYQVVQVQQGRVTFVNGQWQGKFPISADYPQQSLESCPQLWDYLRASGPLGWEVASSVEMSAPAEGQSAYLLIFLKRELAER